MKSYDELKAGMEAIQQQKKTNRLINPALDYSSGKTSFTYDPCSFDFQKVLFDAIAQHAKKEAGFDLKSLEYIHNIPGINENVEEYRQVAFSTFRSERFQNLFKNFGIWMIDKFFDEQALLQKTPTIRIQLPNAASTNYHSDAWYGHGESVRSFWVPLVDVSEGNTLYIANNRDQSIQLMNKIVNNQPPLTEIDTLCREICIPFEGSCGDVLSFTSEMVHGAEKNTNGYTRVTFDFRIATDPHDLGTKPKSNFFSRLELMNKSTDNSEDNSSRLKGISYSNLCNGVSAKTQVMVCANFAKDNGIHVNGNQSEILPFSYLPVLRHYIEDRSMDNNCIVTYGTDIFSKDKSIAEGILNACDKHQKTLVLSSQGFIYTPNTNHKKVIDLM